MNGGIQFDPVPYDEAAKIVADRPIVSQEVFKRLLPELRARSFLITGVEDMNVVQQIRDLIAEIPRGGSWEDAKKQIVEKLGPWMDEESASKRATLLMRHHGFQAYAAAHYREMDEQRQVFPYWKYLTMGDERVRESHAKLHGLILRADDPFWKDHFPPWDWGCRCQVVPVTEDEYREAVGAGRIAGQMAPTYSAKSQGWSLGDAGLKALHQRGILDDGDGQPVGVESPVARALRTEGPKAAKTAYQWNPGDLSISMDELQARYDAETWAQFVAKAKKTRIAEDLFLYDWMVANRKRRRT